MHSNSPSEHSACERFRDAWIDAAPRAWAATGLGADMRGQPADLREHWNTCAACQRVVAAWPLAARALSELPRQSAPRELDSAVVAAIQAGARTDRAVRALERLARLTPPEQLAEALEQPSTAGEPRALPLAEPMTRASAPRVLERLVSEELSDPAKARARRHVGGLRRLTAPAELTALVEQRLQTERARSLAAAALRVEVRRRLRLALGAAAAFALVAIAVLVERPQQPSQPRPDGALVSEPQTTQPRQRPFRVEHASSLASLSPMTRGMLDSASSGLSQTQRD